MTTRCLENNDFYRAWRHFCSSAHRLLFFLLQEIRFINKQQFVSPALQVLCSVQLHFSAIMYPPSGCCFCLPNSWCVSHIKDIVFLNEIKELIVTCVFLYAFYFCMSYNGMQITKKHRQKQYKKSSSMHAQCILLLLLLLESHPVE